MSDQTTEGNATVTPAALAEHLAAGGEMTVLDVREDAPSAIEAPSASTRHLSAERVLADPAGVARELSGPVTVVCNRGQTANPVAEALREHGAHAAVLAGGMDGWIAALRALPVELGIDGLELDQVQRPGRGCLSYLLAGGDRALVVDPAPDVEFYLGLADELGVRIADVFDTHLHADHLSGARRLAELAGARLRLPAATLERGIRHGDRAEPLQDGDRLELGGVALRAIALPGHTTDMTGLLVADRALISGDSLFADGIARPDLERGDPEGALAMARTLHGTLHDRILALGDDVVLLPGHDHPVVRTEAVAPTLGDARKRIPELGIDDPDTFARNIVAELPARPANYEAVIAANAGRRAADPELEAGGNSCAIR